MKIYNVLDNCHGDDTTAIPFLNLNVANNMQEKRQEGEVQNTQKTTKKKR